MADKPLRDLIELVHPDGVRVTVHLPAPMGRVGETLVALGELGYTIPAAEGKTKMTVEIGARECDRIDCMNTAPHTPGPGKCIG